MAFVSTGGGGYRPADPTGTGPDVVVTFDTNEMTVTRASGSSVAHRAPSATADPDRDPD
jgi:hypothetical protein